MAPWTSNYIYAAKHYVTVLREGPPALFFDQPSNPASPASSRGEESHDVSENNDDAGEIELDSSIFHPTGSRAEDVALVRNQGLEVDDDNEPAPENIPTNYANEVPLTTSLYPGQRWGWDGIDQREVAIQTKNGAGFENGWSPAGKSWMEVFFICFLPFGCLIVAWLRHLLQS